MKESPREKHKQSYAASYVHTVVFCRYTFNCFWRSRFSIKTITPPHGHSPLFAYSLLEQLLITSTLPPSIERASSAYLESFSLSSVSLYQRLEFACSVLSL